MGRLLSLGGLLAGAALTAPGCLWEGGNICPGLAQGERFRVDVGGADPSTEGGSSCEDQGLDLGLSQGFMATVEGQRGKSCFVWGKAELKTEFQLEFPQNANDDGDPEGLDDRVWTSGATVTSDNCSGYLTLDLAGLEPAPISSEGSKSTLRVGWNRRSGDRSGCPSNCHSGYAVRLTRVEGPVDAGGAGP